MKNTVTLTAGAIVLPTIITLHGLGGRGREAPSDKVRVVFQTVSQQRSDKNFRFVFELVRNGKQGKINKVITKLPGGVPYIKNWWQN